MAITNAMSTSLKQEVMQAVHNFTTTTGNVFKAALFTSAATLGAATTAYAVTNEVAGTGYTAGGFAWTAAQNVTPAISGTTAFTDWSVDPSWAAASFTANGAQIYNSTASNKSIVICAFGADKTVSAGTFTMILPAADATNAIVRFA